MISKIKLNNFRNYNQLSLDIPSPTTIFCGGNGNGKTNILESLYFMSMLRSFRTSKIAELKKIGTTGFSIMLEIANKNNWKSIFEANYIENRTLKIDGKLISKASEFIKKIKTVVFSPEDIRIISDSSGVRRRFLNIFLSMIEPAYFAALKDYHIALKIRNKLLRTRCQDISLIKSYEPILAEKGIIIMNYREEYLNLLSKEISEMLAELKYSNLSIVYKRQNGTRTIDDYLHRFETEREKEREKGFSNFGAQLDDFNFIYNNLPLRQFGSMGQCRLIALCLKMAEMNIVCKNSSNTNVIALIDDVTGELDERTEAFFYNITNQAEQRFFTFTQIPKASNNILDEATIFNINNGIVE